MTYKKILISVAAILLSAQVNAGEINVSNAWARATAPGQEVGLVGMVITSQKDGQLVAVSSPASASAEIHTMTMDKGVMQMRQLENLPLTANQAATLGMGGNHLMLISLKKALKTGDKIPLTLTFRFADKKTENVEVTAIVKSMEQVHNEHSHH